MNASPPSIRALFAGLFALLALVVAAPAQAGIKNPGDHQKYNVELEPHFLVQWEDTYWADDGLGVGLRATIPIIDNGPVTSINNNFGIGFGLDWAHFSGDCYYYRIDPRFRPFRCTGNHFWLPVVAQWNFFFTPTVSAFAELGFGIQHATWNNSCDGNPNVAGVRCGYDDSDTSVRPVFAIGPRFHVADSFAITLRIGVPYLSIGGSFFL